MPLLIYGGAGGGTGTDVSDTTATASDVLPTKYFYTAAGAKTEGAMSTKAAATILPSTSDQTITAGQYLSGAQTISGYGFKLYNKTISVVGNALSDTITVDAGCTPYSIKLFSTAASLNTNKAIIFAYWDKSTQLAQNDSLIGFYYSTTTEATYGQIAKISSYALNGSSLSITIIPYNSNYIFLTGGSYYVRICAVK